MLREHDWRDVDVENVADELEDLSRSEHRGLKSHLRVLMTHVFKWHHQVEQRSGSWFATILEQQAQIDDILSDSPSLRRALSKYAEAGYGVARAEAAAESGLPETTFPATMPYTVEQLMTFRPAARDGDSAKREP